METLWSQPSSEAVGVELKGLPWLCCLLCCGISGSWKGLGEDVQGRGFEV